jgi:membrane protease YdiL (CAAX protease family)
METTNNNVRTEKRKFRLYEHPWLSLLVFIVTGVFSMGLTGTVIFGLIGLSGSSLTGSLAQECSFKILSSFILAPFVLRLPKGKRTYRQFLDDIGFTRVKPFFRLVLLALSCYIILALSQVATSLVYRLSEGQPITWNFIRQVLDLSGDLPPSPSLLFSIAGALEEVGSRGIVLTVFLNKYSERRSIIFSSLAFGLMHLLNLTNGANVVWVMGTGHLGFYHRPVLWLRVRPDTQPSAIDDRSLSGKCVYWFVDRLHAEQGCHRDPGSVRRDSLAWCCSGDSDDLVDQVLHVTVAAR